MSKSKTFIALTIGLVLALGVIGSVWANRSAQTGTVVTTTAGGDVHAVVVGINDYCPLGAGGPDLNFSVNDANDAKAALKDAYGVPDGNIALLSDGAATKTAIRSAITSIGSVATDDVVIFLSGHGLISNPRVDGVDPDNDGEKRDNGYLVNSASCATGLEVLWDGELRSDLASINANRIIVLGDFSFPSGFNKDLSQVTNVLYLAGAKGEEFEVGGTIQNGVFTEKFINRGIRDR